jgi:metacaspase-1
MTKRNFFTMLIFGCFMIIIKQTQAQAVNTNKPDAYALLIAPNTIDIAIINTKYQNQVSYGTLIFTEPDIKGILNVLDATGFINDKIFNLSGRKVNKKEVIDNLIKIKQLSDTNDLIFIYFTGHGDQRPDMPPIDEPDSLDEVLVLSDDYLFDDEINLLLKSFSKKQRIVMMIDACHSGTSYKLEDNRPTRQRKADELLETKKQRSNKVFEDELAKNQKFNAVACSISNYRDNNRKLSMIYYGATTDDTESKATTTGSYFTLAFASKFSRYRPVWKTLNYKTLFCAVNEAVNSTTTNSQSTQYKEIGNTEIFTNDYPLKIK